MMDMRNSRTAPRELYENTLPRRGFRGRAPYVPAGRFQIYADGINGKGIPGTVAAGQIAGQHAGQSVPLQYEPEDGDGRIVPIADPPVPDGMTVTEEDGGAPGTCGGTDALGGWPLAMVYAPDQVWQNLYDDEEALGAGTLFRELNLPFCPGCRKNGR